MWSPMEKCWVPNCSNTRDRGYTKNFFPLPTSPRYREIWLSLAGKKSSGMEALVYFCQDHFDPNVIETYMDKFVCLNATATPYFNMPERICRTCMSIIMDGDIFSVLSAKVPCTIPPDIKSELLTCRPEPLLQVLKFCIPELNLSHDPLPLTCYRCYHNIWLFYIFKLTCNAVEKGMLRNMTPSQYGKLLLCKACPTTSSNSFFDLKEESPMGKMLKQMFLSNHSVETIPLKVCLNCWNILFKLEKFVQQCLAVEQKMQRHLSLNQFVAGGLPQVSTSVATGPSTSQLGHHYGKIHPYILPTQRAQEMPSGMEKMNRGTPSTSVIQYSGKQEEIYARPPPNYPIGSKIIKMNSTTREGVGKIKMAREGSNSTMTSGSDLAVAEISDDETDSKERDLAAKQRLTLEEKTALAVLMLKHGAPLKADVSPKIHFEAWVNIVREFHETGHERPLEIIQKTWKAMKQEAEEAWGTTESIGHLNRLVMNYIRGDDVKVQQHNDSANCSDTKKGNKANMIVIVDDCDVICIDDEECNDSNETKVTEQPRLDESKTIEEKPIVDPTRAAETPSSPPKKRKKEKKQEDVKHLTRQYWSQEQRLKLVRDMRRQYDLCLENSELISGKAPWKMILERLMKTEYQDYSYKKLYALWSKMKMSATIHEKDGTDILDEEVWEMLQIQNAVQKSVVTKEVKLEEERPSTSRLDDNNSNSPARENNGNEKSEVNDAENADTPNVGNKTDSDQQLSNPTPTEASDDGPSASSETNTNQVDAEADKLELIKLMKKELKAMLDRGEHISGRPWQNVISNVVKNGYDRKLTYLYQLWRVIRKTDREQKGKGQATPLDKKLSRLLALHARSIGRRRWPQTKKAVGDAEVTDEDNESSKATLAKAKMDLIHVVMNYGGDVFRVKKDRRAFWSKILADFNAKGYSWNMPRMRTCWSNCLTSAKQAWAAQKKSNEFDKVLIDFMTKVIMERGNSSEDGDKIESDAEGKSGEDLKEADDSFDEFSERSEASYRRQDNGSSEDDKATVLNYDYVSLEDIENGYAVDKESSDDAGLTVKEEPLGTQQSELPFKIESYTSEEVIEITDSDD